MTQIAVIVGSLRKESINRQLGQALAQLAAPDLEFKFLDLTDVPMFNQDDEADPPAPVVRIRRDIAEADGVLLITPEYNRSVPAVLKNAVDWISRPYGKNGFAGKPGAIIGTSQGAVGTAAAQSHLRSIMTVLDLQLLNQPEVYLVFKPGLIDDQHNITNEGTLAFLEGWTQKFTGWVQAHAKTPAKAAA
jgi:chromate reductase